MNFFTQQDRARRNTLWLIFMFFAAVSCLIALTIAALAVSLYFIQQPTDSINLVNSSSASLESHAKVLLSSEMIYWVTAAVLIVVFGGSIYKLITLGGSGRKVAEALGGRPILPNTTDPEEKKILNIVEEMAIASGNPVPPVYIMEEPSINAFAAGMDRRNAVIGVTRGCIKLLSRDELQGVVAHEFSHIHFGDMRINLRLVAILHGILLIGLIGSYMLRSGAYRSGYRRSYSSSNSKNRSAQLGIGLVLLILGYVGVFFGNIIKAAVSRQREFLADASAVQFTRNPEGIANALKKIGGLSQHAILESPTAEEFSHFYFGQGIKSAFGNWTATHPPLRDRIKRVQPRWDGKFISVSTDESQVANNQTKIPGDQATYSQFSGEQPTPKTDGNADVSERLVDSTGTISPKGIADAAQLINALPKEIYDAAHEPFAARALIYGLFVDRESKSTQTKQLAHLKNRAHPVTFKTFQKLFPELTKLPRKQFITLLELAMPALKSQSPAQYQVFKKNLVQLIKADGKVSLMEWCFFRSITSHCEEKFSGGSRPLTTLSNDISVLLAAVCFSGKTNDTQSAYTAADKHLPGVKLALERVADISFQRLDKALASLNQLRPLDKPKLLKAIVQCIRADNKITEDEIEFFRAVADSLNCPMPITLLHEKAQPQLTGKI